MKNVDKFSKYDKVLFGVLMLSSLMGIVFISGCVSKSPSQPLTLKPELVKPMETPPPRMPASRLPCAIFGLGKRTGQPISDNNEAFDVLKEYWYICEPVIDPQVTGGEIVIAGCIPPDMTGDEAIKKEVLEYRDIVLENGEKIKVWVLKGSYAADESGNLFGCVQSVTYD